METTVLSIFTGLATGVTAQLMPIAAVGAGILAVFMGVRYGKSIFMALTGKK